MFTLTLILLLLHVMPQVSPAQAEAVQDVKPYKYREDQGQTTKVILQNRLTVLIRDQHAVPLASITTFVKAGYFDEEDRISDVDSAEKLIHPLCVPVEAEVRVGQVGGPAEPGHGRGEHLATEAGEPLQDPLVGVLPDAPAMEKPVVAAKLLPKKRLPLR